MDCHWAGVLLPTLRTPKGQFDEFAHFKASAPFSWNSLWDSFEFHDKLLVINSELLKLSPDFIFAKNCKGILLYQVIQI